MTYKLKEGLDITKLTGEGADFEVVTQEDTAYIEDEEEVEEKLLYQSKVVEHLNPECADLGEEESSDSDANLDATVSVYVASVVPWWLMWEFGLSSYILWHLSLQKVVCTSYIVVL